MTEPAIGSEEWRLSILAKIEKSSTLALDYQGGQLACGDDALKAALEALGSEGVRRLVWDTPPSVPGVLLWVHPAWSSLNGDYVQQIGKKLAKQLDRTIWWAKDERSKWEVLAYENPEKHGMSTDFIATFSKAGEYEIVGVS